jgi:hypothetical protein
MHSSRDFENDSHVSSVIEKGLFFNAKNLSPRAPFRVKFLCSLIYLYARAYSVSRHTLRVF